MEALGIDIRLLIAQIVNFLIFYLIFKKFIAKPLLTYLKKQQDEEVQRAKLTHDLETAHTAMEDEQKKFMKELKDKQKVLLAEAKQSAEVVKADIVTQAQKESSAIIEAGKESIAQEKTQLMKEVSASVKQMTQTAIEKGLADFLTPEMQKSVTQKIISSSQSS